MLSTPATALNRYIAEQTLRLVYADAWIHHFLMLWNNSMLNVVWDNSRNRIFSVNNISRDDLLEEDYLSNAENEIKLCEDDLKMLEFILYKYLTTK